MKPTIVSRDEWLVARRDLLKQEKAMTKELDRLAAARRQLPWVRVEKEYTFDGPNGQESLTDLFEERSQLIVYHFMFGPEWTEGCLGCSFWADNFNGTIDHINQRDATMLAVSRTSLKKINAFKERMGWTFKWVSSLNSEFNFDFYASYPEDGPSHDLLNFEMAEIDFEENHGVSVFYKNEEGEIFHTYSVYERGIDIANCAYQWMDMLPKGRDEAHLPYATSWLKLHDQY